MTRDLTFTIKLAADKGVMVLDGGVVRLSCSTAREAALWIEAQLRPYDAAEPEPEEIINPTITVPAGIQPDPARRGGLLRMIKGE